MKRILLCLLLLLLVGCSQIAPSNNHTENCISKGFNTATAHTKEQCNALSINSSYLDNKEVCCIKLD